MKRIFLFGECMVELIQSSSQEMHQSFAGDVYNTAVYLKRAFNDIEVGLVTAIGADEMSQRMLDTFKQEQVSCDHVFQSSEYLPGLYSIETDEQGERSFAYWRNNSAARQVMQFVDKDVIDQLSKGDVFFFSGISVAVVDSKYNGALWGMITELKFKGVQIIFDPNYRARLWNSPKEAKDQFEFAFSLADIVLPSVDDFSTLYGLNSAEQVHQFFDTYTFKELVVKNGEKGLYVVTNGEVQHYQNQPVEKVVDTTSAGDSFNGLYVGARALGLDTKTSIELASKAAAFVIQHRGAIVPREEFGEFLADLINLPKPGDFSNEASGK